MLKFILIGFVISLLMLFLVNRYVYSWAGLLLSQIGLCEYKSIYVPVENGHNQKLTQFYDIPQITAAVRTLPNYQITGHNTGYYLVVTRDFNGVKYNITFSNSFNNRNEASEFNLSTYNFDGYNGGSIVGGENCTTPSYVLEKNVYSMIDDLPLNDSQKTELKQYVGVNCGFHMKSFF